MIYKNNILILDVETAGDPAQPAVYDIGWRTLDKNLNVTSEHSYLIAEIWGFNPLMRSAYYANKIKLYERMIELGTITVKPIREVIDLLVADIRKYRIKVISAYNVAFDSKALQFTINLIAKDKLKLWERTVKGREWLCIWHLATTTFMQSADFRTTAYYQHWLSDKGNFKTSAEIAYRYLTGKFDFIEDHTGLEDVKIETEILKYCLKNYKGVVSYGLKFMSWQNVQDKVYTELWLSGFGRRFMKDKSTFTF